MELYIITGASKGLGEAIALQALEKGHEVHALSRTKADVSHEKLTQHQIDLINLEEAEQQFESLLSSINPDRYSGITLINNAGMVTPIKRAGEASLDELQRHYQLNLTAPVLLSQLFTRRFASYSGKKRLSTLHQAPPKTHTRDGVRIAAQKQGLTCLRGLSDLNRRMKNCR